MDTSDLKSSSVVLNTGDQRPPSYHEEIDDAPTQDQRVAPALLVLSNHHIIPEGPSNSDPKPLYELNRGVAVITNATTSVTFSRLDYSVRDVPGGDPTLKVRKRHLYSLEHNRTDSVGCIVRHTKFADSPSFWCKSESKRTLGDLGLKSKKKLGFAVQPVNRSELTFVESKSSQSQAPFDIEFSKKDNRYVWTDASGTLVAYDTIDDDGKHRLDVRVELQRPVLDTLVALWCLRIWCESAKKDADEQPSGGLREGMVQSALDG